MTRNLSGKKKNDGESFAACEDLLVVFLLKVISFGILIFFSVDTLVRELVNLQC